MPRPRPKKSLAAAASTTKGKARAASPTPQEQQQQSSTTPPPATKVAAPRAAVPSSDIYDVSDREKERIAQRVAETTKTSGRTTRASQHLKLNSDQTRALDSALQRRDEAMGRLDDLSSTSQLNPPGSTDPEPMQPEPTRGRAPRLTDVSGLDLDDDLYANLDETLDDTEAVIPDSQTGYRSADTSTFSIGMFRRRPRQSSIMGRDDPPIRPSSRGQMTPSISSTINFGNFRRRAREPSVVGTARKARAERSVSRGPQASRQASILGDGDDSGPDGESTPLGQARRRTRSSHAADALRDESPVRSSRKRKSLESHQDGREKRHAADTEPEAQADVPLQSIEVEVERTPSPPRGRTRQRSPGPFSTPTRDDPDMAPPLSSSGSESDSPVALPPLDNLAHRTYHTRKPPTHVAKTPELDDASSSELSSPPSLTHSPNFAPAKPAPQRKPAPPPQQPKKLTTADLTALLPRRRHKPSSRARDSNDPFDLDGSEDEAVNDNDETFHVDSRAAARRKKTRQPPSRSAANRQAKTNGGAGAGPKKRAVRTYGSAANEDKENENVEDEIVVGGSDDAEDGGDGEVELPAREKPLLGEELQKAAKKFKEVDQWQLSFEMVESSSPGPDPYAR
ncbi:hypothetical protein VTJ49DRAFT_1203 [Mycothermus thermophilus]|uniref:Uncharacterized protein n=1 Tax=Humicola insolens TaxID=85995 RepID=A0ABR3VDE9_HUMIN